VAAVLRAPKAASDEGTGSGKGPLSQLTAQVASTACSPLWLQTAHRAVCLTRRAQRESQVPPHAAATIWTDDTDKAFCQISTSPRCAVRTAPWLSRGVAKSAMLRWHGNANIRPRVVANCAQVKAAVRSFEISLRCSSFSPQNSVLWGPNYCSAFSPQSLRFAGAPIYVFAVLPPFRGVPPAAALGSPYGRAVTEGD